MTISITASEDTIYINVKNSGCTNVYLVGEKECLHVTAQVIYAPPTYNSVCEQLCAVYIEIEDVRNNETIFKRTFLLTKECPVYIPMYFYDKYNLFKDFKYNIFKCGIRAYCVDFTLELHNKYISR